MRQAHEAVLIDRFDQGEVLKQEGGIGEQYPTKIDNRRRRRKRKRTSAGRRAREKQKEDGQRKTRRTARRTGGRD